MKDVVSQLNFDGNCREAMEFYKKSFGAEPCANAIATNVLGCSFRNADG